MSKVAGLHWLVDGQPQAEPLLLCSGLGGRAAFWDRNVEALTAHRRVIRFDQRGIGGSDRALDGVVTLDSLVDDVIALLDGLGIRQTSFVGHGMGALTGLALALRAPERLTDLILVNGWSSLDPHLARCLDVQAAMLRDTGPRAWARAEPLLLYPAAWVSAESRLLDEAEEAVIADFPTLDAHSKRVAALRRADLSARLGEIAMPVLLIATEDDMMVPSDCSQHLAQALPRAELKLLPRGGHACNATVPQTFATFVTSWLNRMGKR